MKVDKSVLKTFHKYQQNTFNDYESGGILLGFVFDKTVVINKATIPGKEDKRGLFFFHRDKKRAQSFVDEAFNETQGTQIYIGDWHTHSEKNPRPSFKDELEIKRAFYKSSLNLNFIICIIIGNNDLIENIWVGYYDNKQLISCS